MFPASEIEWGPIDAAEPDENFELKFAETDQFRDLFDPRYVIIFGEKGTGKTAFLKKYFPLNVVSDSATLWLKFDDIEFSAIIKNLNDLSALTDIARTTFITNFWKYVIIVQAAKALILKQKISISTNGIILRDYLRKKCLIKRSTFSMLLVSIERAWKLAERLTSREGRQNSSIEAELQLPSTGLSSQVIDTLKSYPIFDPDFVEFEAVFSKLLMEQNVYVNVAFDGLDRLETNLPDSKIGLDTIFNGLAQAVYDISISPKFHKSIKIKCLFPYDRYIALSLRDIDKIGGRSCPIVWTYEGLKLFLQRRMVLNRTLSRYQNFEKMWEEFMPSHLFNDVHAVEEKTLDYLFRHTMYRPRHLQIHLERLSKRHHGQIIDKSAIRKSIQESSDEIVKGYIKEYEIDHPNLAEFLLLFRGKPTVMKFEEFSGLIRSAIDRFKVEMPSQEKINLLYSMGLFGIVRWIEHREIVHDSSASSYLPPISPKGRSRMRYWVEFYYKKANRNVATELKPTDEIALHPLFFGHCQLVPVDGMVIG